MNKQTVYTVNKYTGGINLTNPLESVYVLTEEELRERDRFLLASAFNQLSDMKMTDEYYGRGHNLPLSFKETFINQQINKQP